MPGTLKMPRLIAGPRMSPMLEGGNEAALDRDSVEPVGLEGARERTLTRAEAEAGP